MWTDYVVHLANSYLESKGETRLERMSFALLTMGVSTVIIGLLPTYAQIGVWAPILLVTLRAIQGFAVGGEWGGAALMAVESAPPGRRAFYSSGVQVGYGVGLILATGSVSLLSYGLSDADFTAWGWRLPFLASAVLVGLGLWVRLKLVETPAFTEASEAGELPKVPIATLLTRHGRATLTATAGVIACFAMFYLATAFALGYGTTVLGYGREAFLGLQIGAILFLALGIVIACAGADRVHARFMLACGFIGTIASGLSMGALLGSGSAWGVFAWLALTLTLMGFAYGPLGGWLPSLFPAEVRYTGTSVGFNVGGIIGGALAPIAAQALAQRGGLGWVGLYLVAAGVLSLIGLAIAPRGGTGSD